MKWNYETYKEEKRQAHLAVLRMPDEELREMFVRINERNYTGAIIIDELKMLPAVKMKRLCAAGYYQGDNYRGSIYICREVHSDKGDVEVTLIHEMTHQLQLDHNQAFQTLERIYNRPPTEPVPTQSYRLLSRYLLNNIVAKIEKGLLPPSHLEKFKQSQVLKAALR